MRNTLLFILIPLICVTPVAPAEIVVGGGCTLPDAITSANSDTAVGACSAGSGDDTVVLTEDVELTAVDNGVNGLPKIESAIVIEGNRFSISRSDTAPQFRIFEVSPTGALQLRDVVVSNGSCPDCSGGAIFTLVGDVAVIDSRLQGNFAGSQGGGLAAVQSDVVLRNSTVSDNSSVFSGGGVSQDYGTLTITGSTIARNTAGSFGGGVGVDFYTFQGTTIVNSTISGNSAPSGGGGIHMGVYSSGGVLAHSTLSGNYSGWGSIYVYPGSMVIADSIVANHIGGFPYACIYTVDGGNNFDDDGTCGGQPITGLDPVLRQNGGRTSTHALLAGSSAIDAVANCPQDADQRGFGRSASCDSGAFEFGAFRFDIRSLSCPGPLRVRGTFLEPGATAEIFLGPAEGVSQVVGGLCDGTELGITDPVLLGEIVADANGRATGTFALTAEECGQFLQAVESTTCSRSVVRQTG